MNKKASYTLRIVAGAYLIYLAYSLIKGYIVEHEVSVGFMVVGILFGAVGLFFCVTGLQGQRQVDREEQEAQEACEEALPLPSGEIGAAPKDTGADGMEAAAADENVIEKEKEVVEGPEEEKKEEEV